MNQSYLKALQLIPIVALLVIAEVNAQSIVVPLEEDFYVIPIKAVDPDSDGAEPIAPMAPSAPLGFDYVRKNERILTGFPIGHNLPMASNQLFYNLELDGYGGLPFGSCLKRGYLMDDADATKVTCSENENKDLMRVWANRNPNLKNVLLKNMTIKNAFRTYNAVDGEVVTSSGDLPHTDTFQMFYLGSSEENPDWLGVQDTIIKNSDNSLMITGGGRFKGGVYQNLHTLCDSEFVEDDTRRVINDYTEFLPDQDVPVSQSCTNSITFYSDVSSVVWLIDIQPGRDGSSGVQILNQLGPVIAVGAEAQDWSILTRAQRGQPLTAHPNVRYYPSIEAALQAESRPPFIEYSCSGWLNPPVGCETRLGYFN